MKTVNFYSVSTDFFKKLLESCNDVSAKCISFFQAAKSFPADVSFHMAVDCTDEFLEECDFSDNSSSAGFTASPLISEGVRSVLTSKQVNSFVDKMLAMTGDKPEDKHLKSTLQYLQNHESMESALAYDNVASMSLLDSGFVAKNDDSTVSDESKLLTGREFIVVAEII